jgi:NAD(P)-dependent dehydrogenase (short-subunit alcohol dehydrogenase family)
MKNYTDVFSLKGKTVLAIGGLGRLGLPAAKAMSAFGARVVILDIDSGKAKAALAWAKKNKCRLYYEYFDVCDLEGCEPSLRRFVKKYGLFHVLVNSSFPHSPDWAKPLEQMTVPYLRENMDKHLNGYLWASRMAGFLMKEARVRGSIINFGSTYGVVANDLTIYEKTPLFGEMTYSAIKGGIVNMTRFLASYFGRYGIRANCLCPGGIFEGQHPVFVKNYQRKTLLKRMGMPEDILGVVVFLASDASSYITGTTFMVDGGWTAT